MVVGGRRNIIVSLPRSPPYFGQDDMVTIRCMLLPYWAFSKAVQEARRNLMAPSAAVVGNRFTTKKPHPAEATPNGIILNACQSISLSPPISASICQAIAHGFAFWGNACHRLSPLALSP
ncbi:hypothetical protein CGRA01v4_07828 [Colletotrichum graminicola]|nr:hypothetical protein CGRA01v4_07828 [Colletotrichum graminicola]